MIAATIHRWWAREYLARAQYANNRDRKRRYLQLAVTNTVCARKLEKRAHDDARETMQEMSRPRTGRLQ
jgi:hypothetical protein